MKTNTPKEPRNYNTFKTWVIAILVTVLFSLISGAVGFWTGINFAESKQRQADNRVSEAVAGLKAEASE